jgi:hypothetical protein
VSKQFEKILTNGAQTEIIKGGVEDKKLAQKKESEETKEDY